MKKITFLFVICMLLFLSKSTVLAEASSSNATNVSNTYNMQNDTDKLDQSSNLQLMFAKLQMELAEAAKKSSLDCINQISQLQAEQKLASQFLNDARRLKANTNPTEMPQGMVEYMNKNSLTYDKTGDDLLMNREEWDVAIASLDNHLIMLGNNIQQLMVYVQDYMGQYNSYLQGANSQISNSNRTLTNLARGQSMYGDSDASMLVTALIVGIVLGCVITLAVQNVKKRNVKL